MFKQTDKQGTLSETLVDDYLLIWLESFMIDRKAQGVREGTLHFYQVKFKAFIDFCKAQSIKDVQQITSTTIRKYILWLEENGHNDGGRHGHYRAIRAFLNWYKNELEPEDWRNPIEKVSAPRVDDEPLEPVSIDTISKLIATCNRERFTGCRDKAILLCLLDTGVRASELINIDFEDVNQSHGDILIRSGKGGKSRTVFLGKNSRKNLRKYLKHRKDNNPALWVTHPRFGNKRLSYWGLRSMLNRRAKSAKVDPPTLHSFRRAFAISMLREGVDIFTLAKLMGHASIDILKRYLKHTKEDIQLAHLRHGPVDKSGL